MKKNITVVKVALLIIMSNGMEVEISRLAARRNSLEVKEVFRDNPTIQQINFSPAWNARYCCICASWRCLIRAAFSIFLAERFFPYFCRGECRRSIAAVLKTVEGNTSGVRSSLSLEAIFKKKFKTRKSLIYASFLFPMGFPNCANSLQIPW